MHMSSTTLLLAGAAGGCVTLVAVKASLVGTCCCDKPALRPHKTPFSLQVLLGPPTSLRQWSTLQVQLQ